MCTSFTDKFLLSFIPPFFLIIIPFDCYYTSDIEADTIRCNRINLYLVRPNRICRPCNFRSLYLLLNTRSMERRIPFIRQKIISTISFLTTIYLFIICTRIIQILTLHIMSNLLHRKVEYYSNIKYQFKSAQISMLFIILRYFNTGIKYLEVLKYLEIFKYSYSMI